MKFSDTLLFMKLKLFSFLSAWEKIKNEVYDDDVQDVCCDKLDMFYICELQTTSVELVHQERFMYTWKSMKLEENFRAGTKKYSTRNVNMAQKEKAEITME